MNRRERLRFRTDITVRVNCLDYPGASIKGRLADLSAHGLSLILDRELPSGSAIRVEWGETALTGETVYCQPRGREFLIGLKVNDPVYDAAKPVPNTVQR
jgi:hypothetical protein